MAVQMINTYTWIEEAGLGTIQLQSHRMLQNLITVYYNLCALY